MRDASRNMGVLAVALAALLFCPLRVSALPPELLRFDYADALRKSLLFYEAQRSGAHHARYIWRVPWRRPAALQDGAAVGVDLSGGWFDAGDHGKFGLPMAYSASMLAWSLVDLPTAYDRAGDAAYARDNLRFVLDYFLQAYRPGGAGEADDRFYYQVGDIELDHAFWGPPDAMTMPRPAFACTAGAPCSEVTGGSAAALAAGSMVFAASDPAYAAQLLAAARGLYAFADRYRSSVGYTQANGYYTSFSGYWDELAWAATWLHLATGEAAYLSQAESAIAQAQDGAFWAHSWDNVGNGTRLLLARVSSNPTHVARIETHLEHWRTGLPRTAGGLIFLDRWGSLRYASTTAFLALAHGSRLSDAAKRDRYERLALSQINYILGDNPRGASYVVGFGANPPRNPHHRAAHDSPTFSIDNPADNRHQLTGALVGGPASANDFDWVDDRRDFVRNEVATDYNAGYSGALAAIVVLAGGGYVPPTLAPTAVRTPTASPTRTATLPPGGGLMVRVVPQSDWGAGYCADIIVTNASPAPVDWTVTVPIEGTLTQSWNAVVSFAAGQLTASGVSWNDIVQPGASLSCGFCANRGAAPAATATPTSAQATATRTLPASTATRSATRTPTRTPTLAAATQTPTRTAPPAPGSATAQVVTQSDWGTGYCANVIVSTTSSTPVDWRVSFSIVGRLTDFWNATRTVTGSVVTAEGMSWNNFVTAGQPVTFGFCAARI